MVEDCLKIFETAYKTCINTKFDGLAGFCRAVFAIAVLEAAFRHIALCDFIVNKVAESSGAGFKHIDALSFDCEFKIVYINHRSERSTVEIIRIFFHKLICCLHPLFRNNSLNFYTVTFSVAGSNQIVGVNNNCIAVVTVKCSVNKQGGVRFAQIRVSFNVKSGR